MSIPARTALRLMTIEAFIALARHKLRSALAILGIGVAVAIVIGVVAVGRAAVQQTQAQFDSLGDNLVWIEAGSRNASGVRTGTRGMTTLTARDADAIRREVPAIRLVSENIDGSFQVIFGDRNWRTRWRGVAPTYQGIKRWELSEGAFFDDEQTARAERVVVIGETVRRELFDDTDPLGEIVTIQGQPYTVIGVLAPKGQSTTGQDQDDTVIMPWTTAQRRIVGKDQTWIEDILCSALSDEERTRAIDQVTALLRESHHIQDGEDNDFNIRHPEDLLKSKIRASRTLERLLIAIASISLLIGGIGVMNVMLASVSQRVTEIGIRLAVGASPGAIQLQFLGEALVLTAVGGGFGLGLAQGMNYLLEHELGWELASSLAADAIAIAAAVLVGLIFGFYPALRASRLDPIEALHAPA